MTKDHIAKLTAEFQRVFTRLFQQKPSRFGVTVVNTEDGDTVLISWGAGSWEGTMHLHRTPLKELDAKDVGSILAYLRNEKPS